jgi:autotransporter-associated beta strand protein
MRAYLASATINSTGATIDISDSGLSALNLTWAASYGNWGVATIGWRNGLVGETFYNLDSVTFDDAGLLAEGKIVNVVGTVHPSAITILAPDTSSPWIIQGTGRIVGVGTTLTKTGGGTAIFNNIGGIDFTGDIILAGGTLKTGAQGGPNRLDGNVAISNNSIIDVSGGPLRLSGVISSPDGSGLIKNGGGTLILGDADQVSPDANTYNGPTVLNGGVLEIYSLGDAGAPSSLGASNSNYWNLVFSGGTLRYFANHSNTSTNRGFELSNGDSTIEVQGYWADLNFTGLVAGVPSVSTFIKSGPGSLTLSNVNNAEVFRSLNVNNGTLNLTGNPTTRPTYGINNGGYGDLVIGQDYNSATLNLTNANLAFANGSMYLGNGTGTSGTLFVKAGVNITAAAGWKAYLGLGSGMGVIEQTGGNIPLAQLVVLANDGHSWGVWNMSGGTAFVNSGAPISFNIGNGGDGQGILSISGAAEMSSQVIRLGVDNNGTGILNLGAVGSGGGVLSVPELGRYSYYATGYLNFHGGTIKATANSAHFLSSPQSLDGTYIYGEGAKIDTNGHDITIDWPLLAPSGKGVAGIAVAQAGTDYTGEPVVQIIGGSGTGATAKATLDLDPLSPTYQRITGIVMTNPGTGYLSTDVLTVKLVGGQTNDKLSSYAGQALAGAVTFADNVTTGGLIKLGAGTLKLTNPSSYNWDNAYAGDTKINAGWLEINVPDPLVTWTWDHSRFSSPAGGGLSKTGAGKLVLADPIAETNNLAQFLAVNAGTVELTGSAIYGNTDWFNVGVWGGNSGNWIQRGSTIYNHGGASGSSGFGIASNGATVELFDNAAFNSLAGEFDLGYGAVASLKLHNNASFTVMGYGWMGGNGVGSDVTIELNDNSVFHAGNWLNLGEANATTHITLNGNAHLTAVDHFDFGWGANTNNTTIANGTSLIHSDNYLNVGVNGTGAQASITMNDSSTISTGTGDLTIGNGYGTGTLNLNNTSTASIGHIAAIGAYGGVGNVNVNDSAHFTAANVDLGINWGNVYADLGHGNFTVAGVGAVVTVTGAGTGRGPVTGTEFPNSLIIGAIGGVGVWNQNAGTTISVNPVILGEYDWYTWDVPPGGGGQSPGSGTLNLNGGTFVAPSIVTRSLVGLNPPAVTTGVINFNGGVLKASAASTHFIATDTANASMTLKVLAGGAILDTQSFDDTITLPFAHASGGVQDGGLTKFGSGTLTLTGALSYDGDTTVNDGTLIITTALNTPNAAVYVATGGTLEVPSLVASSLTIGGPPAAVAVPEPGTLTLLILAGLTAIWAIRRR